MHMVLSLSKIYFQKEDSRIDHFMNSVYHLRKNNTIILIQNHSGNIRITF